MLEGDVARIELWEEVGLCSDVSLPKAGIAVDTSGMLVGRGLRTLSPVTGVAARSEHFQHVGLSVCLSLRRPSDRVSHERGLHVSEL